MKDNKFINLFISINIILIAIIILSIAQAKAITNQKERKILQRNFSQ